MELKTIEFKISHPCVACKKKIPSEKLGIRIAPSDLGDEYLLKATPKHIGQWLHANRCFTAYFGTLDRKHAVK